MHRLGGKHSWIAATMCFARDLKDEARGTTALPSEQEVTLSCISVSDDKVEAQS